MASNYEKYLECNVITDILFKKRAGVNDLINKEEAALIKLNSYNTNAASVRDKKTEVIQKINDLKDQVREISDDIASVNAARDTILNDILNDIGCEYVTL